MVKAGDSAGWTADDRLIDWRKLTVSGKTGTDTGGIGSSLKETEEKGNILKRQQDNEDEGVIC